MLPIVWIRDIGTSSATIEDDFVIGPDRANRVNRGFKDMEPKLRDWAADRMALHPRACIYEAVKLDRYWEQEWDATVIYCPQAQNPGRLHQERCATNLKAWWHAIDTYHHLVVTTPDELAYLIAEG